MTRSNQLSLAFMHLQHCCRHNTTSCRGSAYRISAVHFLLHRFSINHNRGDRHRKTRPIESTQWPLMTFTIQLNFTNTYATRYAVVKAVTRKRAWTKYFMISRARMQINTKKQYLTKRTFVTKYPFEFNRHHYLTKTKTGAFR